MAVALAAVVSAQNPCSDEKPLYECSNMDTYFNTLACECHYYPWFQCNVKESCNLAGDEYALDPREKCMCVEQSEARERYPDWATQQQIDESDIASAVCFEPQMAGEGFDFRLCNFGKDFDPDKAFWNMVLENPDDDDGNWMDDIMFMSESAFASQASLLMAAVAVTTSALF